MRSSEILAYARTVNRQVAEQVPNFSFRHVISGSVALLYHGVPLSPNDIDVWCDDATLDAIAAFHSLRIEVKDCGSYQMRCCQRSAEGMVIEYTGRVQVAAGYVMTVDDLMVANATDGFESAEDLAAEMLLLNRPSPKDDLGRARKLQAARNGAIDADKVLERLRRFGLPERGARVLAKLVL